MWFPMGMNVLIAILCQAGASSPEDSARDIVKSIVKPYKGTWLTPKEIRARLPVPKVILNGNNEDRDLSWPLCQVEIGNETIPGWLPKTGSCSYGFRDQERKSSKYKYLLMLPADANATRFFIYKAKDNSCQTPVEGGRDSEGKPYLICSIKKVVPGTGEVTNLSGKVRPDGVCLIPWVGKEIQFRKYNILCSELKS